MCFAPQRRALFQHRNFQVLRTCAVSIFSLANVFRATTACTFSTSQLPKVVWSLCVLCILTWKSASRHNGVHFFDISTSKKCSEREVFLVFSFAHVLRATTACNFSSLIWPAGSAPAALTSLFFDPPEQQITGKTIFFAAFLLFRAPRFFSQTVSFWISFLPVFSFLTLPTFVFHLRFAHVVRNLTSKFPSVIFVSTYDFNCSHKVYHVFRCCFSHVATWCGEHTSGEGASSDKSHAYVFFFAI